MVIDIQRPQLGCNRLVGLNFNWFSTLSKLILAREHRDTLSLLIGGAVCVTGVGPQQTAGLHTAMRASY